MAHTDAQYRTAADKCKSLYEKKMGDYGCAWRILRPSSLTDQIFIKAQRIRTLQNVSAKKVDEGEEVEFIGIVNYSIMALIQLALGPRHYAHVDLRTKIKTLWIVLTRVAFSAKKQFAPYCGGFEFMMSSCHTLVPICMLPLLLRTFFDTRIALFALMITLFLIAFIVPNAQ